MGAGDPLLALVYRVMPLSLYRGAARLASTLEPSVVCDVGGGTGNLGRALEREGWRPSLYLVVDPDPGLLGRAPRGAWSERVEAVAEALPLRSSACRLLVFFDALHHFPDPKTALDEAVRAAECILVEEVEPGKPLGRLIALLERLAGYPANFHEEQRLSTMLKLLGLEIRAQARGGLLPVYRILACRPRGLD